jgi:hypothetical protein
MHDSVHKGLTFRLAGFWDYCTYVQYRTAGQGASAFAPQVYRALNQPAVVESLLKKSSNN